MQVHRKRRDHEQKFRIEFYDLRKPEGEQLRVETFTNHKDYLKRMRELGVLPCYTQEITETKFFAYPSNPDLSLF